MATIENPFDKVENILNPQERVNRVNERLGDTPLGTPYFLRAKGDGAVMEMGSYVNSDLAVQSEYFKTLDAMMNCV